MSSEKIIQNKKGRFDKAHLWLDFPKTSLEFIRPFTLWTSKEKLISRFHLICTLPTWRILESAWHIDDIDDDDDDNDNNDDDDEDDNNNNNNNNSIRIYLFTDLTAYLTITK